MLVEAGSSDSLEPPQDLGVVDPTRIRGLLFRNREESAEKIASDQTRVREIAGPN